MLPPKKIVGLIGLLGAAGAVWVPQLLNRGEGDVPGIQEEVPALLDEQGDFDPDLGDERGSAAPPRPAPTDGGSSSGSSAPEGGSSLESRADGLLRSVSRSLEAAGSRGSGASELSLGIEPWNPPTTPGAGTIVETGSKDFEETERSRSRERELAELRAYLDAHPVTAVLVGQDESLALIGSRVVRPGDRLFGGRLEVVSMSRAGVRCAGGGTELLHGLPPFHSRGSSGQAGSGEDAADPAGDEAPTAGAEAPTPGPTTDGGPQ